ncbi:MAG: helix-turn-helix domain-containing protein [Prevotellaceae bacterium]|jgi:transcriptional regulator with XRE-family HTH domain|nr:helix-turn-helix domain-containing protein [Prevotellaceae bacterium]
MINQTISDLLREQKKTKTDFADALGIARNTLNNYLSGETLMTSDKIIIAAKYFGVSVGYLFGEMPTEKEKTISEKLDIVISLLAH